MQKELFLPLSIEKHQLFLGELSQESSLVILRSLDFTQRTYHKDRKFPGSLIVGYEGNDRDYVLSHHYS